MERTIQLKDGEDDAFAMEAPYSADEKRIGTWIDGKPLYRKTITCTSPSEAYTYTNVATLSNTWIRNIEMYSIGGGFTIGIRLNSATAFNANYAFWLTGGAQGKIDCVAGPSLLNKTMILNVVYTKTTD